MKVGLSSGSSAQADPYPSANPARVSKNRSPPPRVSKNRSLLRSHSPSVIPEPDTAEVMSTKTKSSGNRGSSLRTTNRRVHFTPEVEDEQVMDPNVISDVPVAPGSPGGTLPVPHFQQTDKEPPTPGVSLARIKPLVPRPAPTQRLPLKGGADVIEETLSDENETPDSRNTCTVSAHGRSRRDDNIRSSIRDLLGARNEALVGDANTSIILEYLLSQVDQGGGEGLVLSSLSPVQMNDPISRSPVNHGPAAETSQRVHATRTTFVGPLNT